MPSSSSSGPPSSVAQRGHLGGTRNRENAAPAAASRTARAARPRSPRPQQRSASSTSLPRLPASATTPRGGELSRTTSVQPPQQRAKRRGAAVTKEPPSALGISKEEIKKKFRELDNNRDGALDLKEIKELFKRGRSNIAESQLEALFEMVDRDKSGSVDFNEFVDYIYATEETKGKGKELEVEIPMGGGGLLLGGKAGNAVVKVGFIERVKIGWRAVALNGQRHEPQTLVRLMEQFSRKGKFSITFEVDEMTALSMMSTRFAAQRRGPRSAREQARRELQELLGCTNLEELGKQSPEQRQAQLADARLPRLLVDAHAVFEAEVLLGGSSGEAEERHLALLRALESDDSVAVREALIGSGEGDCPPLDLTRKDEDGNVPIHLARSVDTATQILARAPDTRSLKNDDGRNLLNEQAARCPDGLRRDYVEYILGNNQAYARQMLLDMDAENICAAIRMTEQDLKGWMGLFPDWNRMEAVLRQEVHEVLPALQQLAGDDWPSVLAMHCFRDVFHAGTHTEQSWSRLGAVWRCLSRTLKCCLNRDSGALEVAKQLLKASTGPYLVPVDMRLPYRHALDELMSELHRSSAEVMEQVYQNLQGEAARWLTLDLKDELSQDLTPDALTARGLFPRLRMDYRLASGGGASEAVSPAWATCSDHPPLDALYTDLKKVGTLGNVRMRDSVYDMLRLAGMGEVRVFSRDSGSLWLTRCYGAYLRGICQGQQQALKEVVEATMKDHVTLGESLFIREEAKKFPRIVEKTLQRIEEINHELEESGLVLGAETKLLLQTSAAFICDINGITCVAQTPEELRCVYQKLSTSFRLLRTKNTYLASVSAADYRDVKLFLGVSTSLGELVVEAQLILAGAFNEKKWMHLPYTFIRGDWDWSYVKTGPSASSHFQEGWRLYHGIQGSLSRADLIQAENVLVSAARQGHFVARGLCHREGWGGFRHNEDTALQCFKAAADAERTQAGRREGKCRLGMFYMGAVQNVAASRKRGLALLQSSAEEGEVEAVYQLAIHELRYEEQKNLIREAAGLGHARAQERLSGYASSTRKVLAADD